MTRTQAAGEEQGREPARSTRSRPLRLVLVGLAVAALVAAGMLLPLDRWILDLVAWIRGAGAGGIAVFALAYVLATVLLLPGSLLTLGAGFAWGPLVGTLIVSPASVAAATLAFVLGRSVARERVARRIAGSRRFTALDRAVGENGFRLVLLLRLSPVFPFNLLNYALGLTRVPLRHYVLASFAGMLPGTFLYAYLGSLVTDAAELLAGGTRARTPAERALFYGGLLATLVVTVLVTRIARRALSRSLPSSDLASP